MATDWALIISTAVKAGKEVVKDEGVQSFLCGSYSDGTPRNMTHAIHGEYLSPKQKKKAKKKKKKKNQAKFRL